MRGQLARRTFTRENILHATYTTTYVAPGWGNSLHRKGNDTLVECPGRPVYFLISTLGRSSQSTVKSSLLCPGRLDFIFSVNFYIFGHLVPSFLAPGYVFFLSVYCVRVDWISYFPLIFIFLGTLTLHFCNIVYLQPYNQNKHKHDFATQPRYNNFVLPTILHNISSHLLSPQHGLLVLSLGKPPSLSIVSTYTNPWIDLLQAPHFQSIHVYQESDSSFAIACKTKSCRTFWYASQPTLELSLQEDYYNYHQNKNYHYHYNKHRSMDNTTNSIFRYFDVPTTVQKYQRPTKAWESWICTSTTSNSIVDCEMLRGFDPAIPNVYRHEFEVKPSTLGPNVGLGLFTKVPISAPSYIMQEVSVHTVALPPITAMCMEDLIDDFITAHPKLFVQELIKVLAFAYGYGIQSDMLGTPSGYFVETSIGFLANHGCNGTYNQMSRHSTLKSEMEESIDSFPMDEEYAAHVTNNKSSLFNPVLARHVESEWSYSDSVLRHVDANEELFTNYLRFVVQKRDWAETVRSLRALCSGKEIGLIARATRTARGSTTSDGSDSSSSTSDIIDKLQKFV